MNTASIQLETRRAKDSDCEALTQLCFRSKQSNGYDSAFMQACRDELTITSATLSSSECWVVQSEQTFCGCGCLEICHEDTTQVTKHHASSAEINLFFVDPDWQRRGVGTLLWQTLLERARHHNIHELKLDADPSAQAFYESLGFEVVGQSASGSIPGRLLPHMRLSGFQEPV